MARLPLVGKPYTSKALIAANQRMVNLYAEQNNDPQAVSPITLFPMPGTVAFGTPANQAACRGSYRTSLGTVYTVVGSTVYFVSANGAMSLVGNVADRPSQIIMSDNGLVVVLTDGTEGWVIDMSVNAFAQIIDPSFYSASFNLFLDTFFVFNRVGTNQFFISLSLVSYGMLSGTGVGNGTIAGGALYTDGDYDGVPLTGGTGTGATALITILGGAVIGVEIEDFGQNYTVGDVLSAAAANIGGTGAGFTYTTTSFALAFDPLDIAAKSGSADHIVAIATRHKELLLIGELTTENWIGTGAADFYFQLQQGAYIDHGCVAPYSVVSSDVLTCWIMKDKQGSGTIVQSVGYELKEISTPGIVAEIKAYADLTDAIGTFFQMADHLFYVLSFPTANKTWFYDISSGIWGEWSWLNTDDGSNNRARIAYAFFAFDNNYISDWETGKIWKLDLDHYLDDTIPIIRMRTFTHLVGDEYERVSYKSFDADVQCGTSPQIDESLGEQLPMIDLSWSDDRGKTFGNPVSQSLGNQGEYLTTVSWNRLGNARDRVFKLQWSAALKTALNGSFITVSPNRS